MKVRQCTSLFLSIMLLVCNTGFALSVHFCEGKLSSISSAFETDACDIPELSVSENCCANDIGASHISCCSNNIIDLQDNTDDVILKFIAFQIDAPFIYLKSEPISFFADRVVVNKNSAAYHCDANAPPLFKLYNRYLYYA